MATKRKAPSFATGCTGTAFARTRGRNRHVTVYPATPGAGMPSVRMEVVEDFTPDVADVILKGDKWERTVDWTELEQGVLVAQVVKV